jgi:hypothetical protein
MGNEIKRIKIEEKNSFIEFDLDFQKIDNSVYQVSTNQYALLYNKQPINSRVNFFSSLIVIQNHYKNKIRERKKDEFPEEILNPHFRELFGINFKVIDNPRYNFQITSKENQNVNEKLISLGTDLSESLKTLFKYISSIGFADGIKTKESLDSFNRNLKLIQSSKGIAEAVDYRFINSIHLYLSKAFEIYFLKLKQYEVGMVINEIKRLGKFNLNLTDSLKSNPIKGNIGRPINSEVPQALIIKYLKDRLNDSKKRFIHQTGSYSGNPNWNQITESYLNSNPELITENIITKRTLIKRFKKAYEEINSTLN